MKDVLECRDICVVIHRKIIHCWNNSLILLDYIYTPIQISFSFEVRKIMNAIGYIQSYISWLSFVMFWIFIYLFIFWYLVTISLQVRTILLRTVSNHYYHKRETISPYILLCRWKSLTCKNNGKSLPPFLRFYFGRIKIF